MKHIRPSVEDLASFVAEQLLDQIDEILAGGGQAHVALTGGNVGTAVLAAAAQSPSTPMIDWNAVHLWWVDERYLPEGDPDRNETQARAAFINYLPIPQDNVHPVPSPAAESDSPEQAASQYGQEIQSVLGRGDDIPRFNIVMLGMGPDGHIASLFPGFDQLENQTDLAVAVHSAPKPPPTRISLTLQVLQAADQIWLTVAGAEKAAAVAAALEPGIMADEVPASALASLPQTTWFLDTAANS